MDKNQLREGRTMPLDNEGLQAMLEAGPSVPSSSVEKDIPPMPEPGDSHLQEDVKQETTNLKEPSVDEGPDSDMKNRMVLPSDKEKELLKSKYGSPLRVVPIPYAREDGKVQTYVLRQITRSQWRAMQEQARKKAEATPGLDPAEIFKEKIVCLAVVWPGDFSELNVATSPAGLVDTLYAIVESMGLFFNPEAIMQLTFTL